MITQLLRRRSDKALRRFITVALWTTIGFMAVGVQLSSLHFFKAPAFAGDWTYIGTFGAGFGALVSFLSQRAKTVLAQRVVVIEDEAVELHDMEVVSGQTIRGSIDELNAAHAEVGNWSAKLIVTCQTTNVPAVVAAAKRVFLFVMDQEPRSRVFIRSAEEECTADIQP